MNEPEAAAAPVHQAESQPSPSSAPSRNTYIIDSEQAAELARLMQQDRLLTEAMGGLLPEEGIALPERGRVLDLACGPGGWALELAFRFPKVEIIGIDISPSVIEYANAQAWSRGLENVHFQVGNVMESLPFPDQSFDLINGRALCGFMLPNSWPRLLAECFRLLKPGGILRCTETEQPLTTSPAFEHFCALGTQALKRAGQSFSPDGRHIGITPVLPRLLRQAGFERVRLRASAIEWSIGTEGHYPVFKDYLVAMELVQPFLLKTGVAAKEELERLYQQAVAEMQADDFCAIWTLLTVWGEKPATANHSEASPAAG
ncbi:MAG: methyltransferase domain-containing protein [Thermogemmatispora sp.]|uniref:class I SAM-dependent methyltransferase n=1 Tax=Thermogemmatispora sp. TaxID=1968838 RepID=UPI002608CA6E|nr:class I SAM-dependent methyltransferase [Thermogemmatispora sp.]MBX5457537.1 methyltransferase domain-containing protein [Thermogemmatispora sp.]